MQRNVFGKAWKCCAVLGSLDLIIKQRNTWSSRGGRFSPPYVLVCLMMKWSNRMGLHWSCWFCIWLEHFHQFDVKTLNYHLQRRVISSIVYVPSSADSESWLWKDRRGLESGYTRCIEGKQEQRPRVNKDNSQLCQQRKRKTSNC